MEILNKLLFSNDVAVQHKTRVKVLKQDESSPEVRELRARIGESPVVRTLLCDRDADNLIPFHPYHKWLGSHWVLACLADLEYSPGDQSLYPILEQVYRWLFSEQHAKLIRVLQGRVRRCASQEGNALYAASVLGLADGRSEQLAERLLKWQWPDGGWNCDKHPEAINSSFMETLIPMRGLARYACLSGSPQASLGVERAADVFLKRELFKRRRDGQVIHPEFTCLHYPCYWHYDILFGLKVMAEAGFIDDPRCKPALDLLETKRLPDGGFPVEKKYYQVSDKDVRSRSRVDWGGASKHRMNEFTSVDALYVLQTAGRLAW